IHYCPPVTPHKQLRISSLFFFFFNATATTEIYTLSLHDALPIWRSRCGRDTFGFLQRSGPGRVLAHNQEGGPWRRNLPGQDNLADRKSTRLNSSHVAISYAVFCLKKKRGKAHYDRRAAKSVRRQE